MRRFQVSTITVVFLLSLLSTGLINCKKVEDWQTTANHLEKKFFFTSATVLKDVKSLSGSIQSQNSKHGFLTKLVSRVGFPKWDDAIVAYPAGITSGRSNSDSAYYVYIPFIKDSQKYVNSVLVVKVNARDTFYKMIDARQYTKFGFDSTKKNRWNAYDVLNLFLSFDNKIFGHKSFLVKDGRLAGKDSSKTFTVEILSEQNRKTNLWIEICQTKRFCIILSDPYRSGRFADEPIQPVQPPYCWNKTTCTFLYYTDDGSFVGMSDPSSSGGGGSTVSSGYYNPADPNSAGWWYDPCSGSGPSVERTLLIDCSSQQVWVPYYPDPVPPDPIDSLLKRYSVALNTKADSLLQLSLNNNNWEYTVILVERQGLIYTKNVKTDKDSMTSRPNFYLESGEALVAYLHTHPRKEVLDRSAPSGGDIIGLKLQLKQHMISFIECGNVRYALAIEDLSKASAFLRGKSDIKFQSEAYIKASEQPDAWTNWQHASQVAIVSMLGSASTSGIGIYVSTNSEKSAFTKLNQ